MGVKKKTKKRGSGGAVLLKTKGPTYFSELAKKAAKKRKEQKDLWNKIHKVKK